MQALLFLIYVLVAVHQDKAMAPPTNTDQNSNHNVTIEHLTRCRHLLHLFPTIVLSSTGWGKEGLLVIVTPVKM